MDFYDFKKNNKIKSKHKKDKNKIKLDNKKWMIRKEELDDKKRVNLTENTIHFLKRSVNYITII